MPDPPYSLPPQSLRNLHVTRRSSEPRTPPSHLGSMTSQERALAVVLALKAHGDLSVFYDGGYAQFMRVCRPNYRNFGVIQEDLERAWRIIETWVTTERLGRPHSFLQDAGKISDRWLKRLQGL